MIGKKIENRNGKQYFVIAQIDDDRALLYGDPDYVVIDSLTYFQETGSWCNGKYFPCFNNNLDSYKTLKEALYYLKHRKLPNYSEDYYTTDDEN